MMASFSGHCDVVRVLIEANANVQKRTTQVCVHWPATPQACDGNVVFLSSYTQSGWTALHFSSQEGHVDVVHVLIEACAPINQSDKVIKVW